MKTTLRTFVVGLLVMCGARIVTYSQGTILFSNRNLTDSATGETYNAPVTLPDGTMAEGPRFTAGLFLVESPGVSLLGTTTLRPGPAAGFWAPVIFSVPQVPPGAAATVRVRVWETLAGSYEAAIDSSMLHGEFTTGQPENNLFFPSLGHPTAPLPTPDLSGIQPLTLVPEPSAFAMLALAGLISLVLKGGRKTN